MAPTHSVNESSKTISKTELNNGGFRVRILVYQNHWHWNEVIIIVIFHFLRSKCHLKAHVNTKRFPIKYKKTKLKNSIHITVDSLRLSYRPDEME